MNNETSFLSNADLDKVAGGFKSAEHTIKHKPAPPPKLPYPLPGNATLKEWLE